ncbi:UDP-2,4-diacetamido-2,4,6-trideoxy-beta-L-altropyranose hydrolase [Brevibacillus agri]|uniref:UDP-2,4-diacetamido-2,4, 6-trideoxy-beta-L-altropyranose hydrolase n=1 Tax=Brevibacillus agri TaxID=51101 RepID=UPI002E25116A|nr:UDP-2,4-diacetamido-2,4,6-trideoxy-beta-L-altropyranose hydrolase [Brevibacillus agri]MED1642044.1 UDP-2,4-diacetamido-2,4,6-trideoxy-beta-L-altropyranose hydrolase [Brevibacillus agri]MED1655876.1 UDP-2,4-diacetamido-2,4,6-trideoxy-beta-L-altropyranose hydrolase [Brevibacillus agri]MED1685015.1 UDP-2,4-diacetamido-2,4,6-trideoxy-beta-L-altropyranose hydrolase [Brevibacillus agri]MED1693612.1 UDP-2,4-diacetamido-2,4,6-trideoxy-beta-L-altropyranose hydrolase [Brevibacillus agri]MED1697574.1 
MKVLFRCDASTIIGIGHFMRCLTIADQLRAKGHITAFSSRHLPEGLIAILRNKGHLLFLLTSAQVHEKFNNGRGQYDDWLGVPWIVDAEENKEVMKSFKPNWLVVDHYSLDCHWEDYLCPFVDKILVIDDLADRNHRCNVLVDQNLYLNMEERYKFLVPSNCITLLGPRYAILRSEFSQKRIQVKKNINRLQRILVFFGGSDHRNITRTAIHGLQDVIPENGIVDVVVGTSNPHKYMIKQLCSQLNSFRYYEQIDFISDLMVKADFSFGAGGSSTWERCCLGLPSALVSIADNQVPLIEGVSQQGAILNLGSAESLKSECFAEIFIKMAKDINSLNLMKKIGLSLVDGLGTERVVNTLESYV